MRVEILSERDKIRNEKLKMRNARRSKFLRAFFCIIGNEKNYVLRIFNYIKKKR